MVAKSAAMAEIPPRYGSVPTTTATAATHASATTTAASESSVR